MKQIIDVPAGHTVTIKQEGSQLIVETKFVSEAGDEFSTEEKKVSVFDKVKPGDILRTASGDSFFIEGVNRRKAFDAIIVLSYTILTADGALEEVSNYTYDRSALVLSTANYVTEPEKQQLFDALRDKYALMWNGKELVNWQADLGGSYWAVSSGGSRKIEDRRDSGDKGLYSIGNYFPEGFLTDARIAEFREVTSKLFASWRR